MCRRGRRDVPDEQVPGQHEFGEMPCADCGHPFDHHDDEGCHTLLAEWSYAECDCPGYASWGVVTFT